MREMRILQWSFIDEITPDSAHTALSATLEIIYDGSKLVAHCTLPLGQSTSLDQPQRIFCYFPYFGTYLEFRRDSLLSYTESSQAAVEEQNGEAQNDIMAPMPCKIIGVIKKQNEEVKTGESVMAIEGMKMEVAIRLEKLASLPPHGRVET